MKRLFLLAGVVAAMISCAQSDVYDINESNPDVIAFDTYVDQTTKGTVFTNETVKETGFGLMAYYTAQDAWLEGGSASAPDFMYNQMVGYSGSAWSYTPLKYWPNEDDDKVTFFAYAPYETTANKVKASHTANTDTGLPVIDFTVQDEAVDMIDFVAGQNMDMVRQQDKVVFNLKHQLARATFSAITNVDNTSYGATANEDFDKGNEDDEDGYSYVVVRSMDIVNGSASNFYTHATYEFDYETTDTDKTNHDQDGIWTIDATSAKNYSFETIMDYTANGPSIYSALNGSGYSQTGVVLPVWKTAYTSLFADSEYLFLIPPAGADGMAEGSEIQVEIVYDIVTVDAALAQGYSATTSTYTVTLPAGTLAQGKAYNYQLTFDVTEVLVDVNIVDWDEENQNTDAGTVDPFDDSIENPIATLSIGDDQTIYAGETITLTPSVTYTEEGDSEDTLTWSCSLDYISITKNEDGSLVVTGKQAGATTITLTSKSGESASVEITVVSSEYSYTKPEGNLEIDETFTPEAAEGVEIPADLTITWSSSDAEIVSVDSETGEITAVAAGTATITGTDQYGNVVCVYSVTVNPYPAYPVVVVDADGATVAETVYLSIGEEYYLYSSCGITGFSAAKYEDYSVITFAGTAVNVHKVTAKSEGTATVVYTSADAYSTETVITFVVSPVAVADVTITGADEIDMATATTFTYTAEVEPSTATDSTVTWAVVSGDATIEDGVLTPTATGTVVISATAGDVTVEKKITVTTSASIEINFGGDPEDKQIIATTSNLLNGQFDATISGTSLTSVVWSADNDEVLLINSATGEFTITGSGYVTITAEVAGAVDTLYVGVSVDGFTIGGDIVGGDSENVSVGGNQ